MELYNARKLGADFQIDFEGYECSYMNFCCDPVDNDNPFLLISCKSNDSVVDLYATPGVNREEWQKLPFFAEKVQAKFTRREIEKELNVIKNE